MSAAPEIPLVTAISRRKAALGLLASALSGSLAGCEQPEEEILPYVEMPERLVPGVPLRFATTLPLNGFGRGVVCTSHEGRPTKVSGNPLHPASLGATDIFAEAAVMGLYDPDRSRSVRERRNVTSWNGFLAALLPRLAALETKGGEGLALLTGPVTSPTLLRLIGEARARFPRMAWHAHAAVDDTHALEGSRLAFGRAVSALPQLDRAAVMLALDADPLGVGPDQIRNARAFATRRRARPGAEAFARLYAAEPVPSLTGAMADHRLAVAPDAVRDLAMALAAALGADVVRPDLPPAQARFLDAVAADLRTHRGAALAMAGPWQPPEVHALVHWINAALDAPVVHVAPVWPPAAPLAPQPLAPLADSMRAGAVDMLIVLGANPVYDAPAGLDLALGFRHVPFSVHHGTHLDETGELCRFHLPAPHPLEEWGDLRAADGTASPVQPLIRPLYATRSAAHVLGLLSGMLDLTAHAAVRTTWAAATGLDGEAFEAWWRRVLHDGIVPDSAAPPIEPGPPRLPTLPPAPSAAPGLTLALRPDPSVWDGSHATNAWLQECPKPFTSQVWGNAALMAEQDARARGLSDGDVVRLALDGRTLEVPVLIRPEVAAGVVMLTLGYGRWRAGAIGTGLGADAYRLRPDADAWHASGLDVAPTGRRAALARVQDHQTLEAPESDILPVVLLAEALHGEASSNEPPPTFYPQYAEDEYAWAMVIDTTLCIGCNACVTACQAENNIPVVGPEEVERGRIMHWLRVDHYRHAGHAGRAGFQPVPCMHCEKAPCEPVCPVAASVHDGEGLNLQVYNRCVGTRFCQSNCPYKVRRFNFFGYADGQEHARQGEAVVAAQHNPDVTVRTRGVMEKCTYCVQRISRQRREAKKENRRIREGEVVTACQSACPTQAIVFGDLNTAGSDVNALRRLPHHYKLLEELGTRPRTTYLKRVRNPNPALKDSTG